MRHFMREELKNVITGCLKTPQKKLFYLIIILKLEACSNRSQYSFALEATLKIDRDLENLLVQNKSQVQISFTHCVF